MRRNFFITEGAIKFFQNIVDDDMKNMPIRRLQLLIDSATQDAIDHKQFEQVRNSDGRSAWLVDLQRSLNIRKAIYSICLPNQEGEYKAIVGFCDRNGRERMIDTGYWGKPKTNEESGEVVDSEGNAIDKERFVDVHGLKISKLETGKCVLTVYDKETDEEMDSEEYDADQLRAIGNAIFRMAD